MFILVPRQGLGKTQLRKVVYQFQISGKNKKKLESSESEYFIDPQGELA